MAAALYARLKATATRLIDRYGYTSQIERDGAPTGPAHDPRPGPPTRHDCKVVETDYSLTDRDQSLVLKGDKLGLISTAVAIEPMVRASVSSSTSSSPHRPGAVARCVRRVAGSR